MLSNFDGEDRRPRACLSFFASSSAGSITGAFVSMCITGAICVNAHVRVDTNACAPTDSSMRRLMQCDTETDKDQIHHDFAYM